MFIHENAFENVVCIFGGHSMLTNIADATRGHEMIHLGVVLLYASRRYVLLSWLFYWEEPVFLLAPQDMISKYYLEGNQPW